MRELVSEHDNLQLFECLGLKAQDSELQDTPNYDVTERDVRLPGPAFAPVREDMASRLRLKLFQLTGKVLNLAGVPGFVRDCDYQAVTAGVVIRVRRTDRYTVITVNGLDIYFNRLAGTIDGIGAIPI